MPMSNAERQKRYREKRKAEGKQHTWVKKSRKILNAGDIARQRFEDLVTEKLKDGFDDLTAWEFYTFLYKKAKGHKPDYSGYAGLEYQKDRETAKNLREKEN